MPATMTPAGQVTIPESVRLAAGLTPNTPLEFSAADGGVFIKEAAHPRPLDPDRFEKIRGSATIKWRSTDEVMALLRGDDD